MHLEGQEERVDVLALLELRHGLEVAWVVAVDVDEGELHVRIAHARVGPRHG
jgi:hypothetical protein